MLCTRGNRRFKRNPGTHPQRGLLRLPLVRLVLLQVEGIEELERDRVRDLLLQGRERSGLATAHVVRLPRGCKDVVVLAPEFEETWRVEKKSPPIPCQGCQVAHGIGETRTQHLKLGISTTVTVRAALVRHKKALVCHNGVPASIPVRR